MSTQEPTVTVYRGSDAFMYLPLYIAMHHRIFDQDPGRLNVTMTTSKARGDEECLRDMSNKFDGDGSDIPIAVCDPMAIFEMPDKERFVVVGTLIKQPTFWLIKRKGVDQISDLICLDPEYSTGHYLGRKYAGEIGAKPRFRSFGTEIDLFIAETANNPKKPIAVLSADALGIARALTSNNDLRIEIDFQDHAEYQHFMTASFVTLRECAERHSAKISHFLHGIQRAISVFAHAPSLAENMCRELSSGEVFSLQMRIDPTYTDAESLSKKEAKKLVSMISIPGKLLSIDMTTTIDDWRAAVTVKAAIEQRSENDRREWLNKFESYVHNGCSTIANRLYMEDPLTFTAYRNAWHEIDPTAKKREMIGNFVLGLWMVIFLILAANLVAIATGYSTLDLLEFLPTGHIIFPLGLIGFVVFSVICAVYSRSAKPLRIRFLKNFNAWFRAHPADGIAIISAIVVISFGAAFTYYGLNLNAWIAAAVLGFIPIARGIYARNRRWRRK